MKSVELVEIPLLETCVLPSAFKCVEELRMENGGKLESIRELKELVEKKRKEEEERRKEEEERERKERERKNAEEAVKIITIHKLEENIVDGCVGVIVLGDGCCNDEIFNKLDLSGIDMLRELKVENECFMYVNEVKIVGLSELESVEIGMNSFTKKKNWYGNDPNRHFYLKYCPKLKSLKMGRYSFSDYSVIEIENVDALEVIEMGGSNFYWGSLELKSILIQIE